MKQVLFLDGVASFAWLQLHEYIDALSKEFFIIAEGGPASHAVDSLLAGHQYAYSLGRLADGCCLVVNCTCSEEEWKIHNQGDFKIADKLHKEEFIKLAEAGVEIVEVNVSELPLVDAAKAVMKAAIGKGE